MMNIKLTNAELVEKALAETPKKVERAARMSINKVAGQVRTQMSREAAKEYFVSISSVRRTVTVKKAGRDLLAVLESKGLPISLAKFKVKPLRVQHKGKKNKKLRVRVKRSSAGATLDRAFVSTIGSGFGVFERSGKSRFPIKKLFGPAIPQMVGSDSVVEVIKETASTKLNGELVRQIKRLTGG